MGNENLERLLDLIADALIQSDIPELFNLFAKRFGSDEKYISLDLKFLNNCFSSI